jgi:O-antigen/teichoic acid export membrane protein
VKRGLLAQTAHTFVSILSGQGAMIAAGIAISRVYGPDGKGQTSYAGIAIMLGIAIADGLGAAIANRVGHSNEKPAVAYAAALRLVVVIASPLIVAMTVIAMLVPSQHTLMYVAVALPFAIYLQTMNGFYLVRHQVERTNYANLATNVGAAFAMLVVILVFHAPLSWVLGIWTLGYVAGAIVVWSGLRDIARIAGSAAVSASLRAQRMFATRSSSAAVMTFFSVRLEVFIVSVVFSGANLGQYTLALAAGEVMWQVSRAISWSAYGRVATLPFEAAAALTARITRTVVACEVAMALVLFIAGPRLITLVYGAAFAPAGGLLRILLPGMAIYAADSILTYFISVKAERPGYVMRIEAATLAVCVVVTLATIKPLGIVGPALATTLGYLTSFVLKTAFVARRTGCSPRDLLLLRREDVTFTAAPAGAARRSAEV